MFLGCCKQPADAIVIAAHGGTVLDPINVKIANMIGEVEVDDGGRNNSMHRKCNLGTPLDAIANFI